MPKSNAMSVTIIAMNPTHFQTGWLIHSSIKNSTAFSLKKNFYAYYFT
jgi:hypothetical protein